MTDLPKHSIIGTRQGVQGAGQLIPEDLVCCFTCGWMICTQYYYHMEDLFAENNAEKWDEGCYARHNYDERGGEAPPANPYEED